LVDHRKSPDIGSEHQVSSLGGRKSGTLTLQQSHLYSLQV
jgi:hypothetical protein